MIKPHIAVLAAGLAIGLLSASGVQAGTSETLQAECKARLGMTASACKCIGDKAEAELNVKQQELVIAVVKEDDTLTQKLQTEISQEDAMKAGEFMTSAPSVCKAQ